MAEILEERPADGVALLRINRPDVLNALSMSVRATLAEIVTRLDADPGVRALVITGDEKAFAAGADLGELRTRTVHDTNFRSSRAAWEAMEACRKPLIAAVNGFALGGGCELALACDFIWASDKARFGQPEVNLGVIPGFGGTQRLARRVGIGRARELVFSGAMIGADQAKAMGLVNEVVPVAELLDRVKELARTIAAKGPLAVAAAKRVMLRGEEQSLDTACELEAQAFAGLFGSEDQREGMKAFLEKRAASFQGR